MEITLPYNYTPREYQLQLLKAMDSGYKRAFCLWHRRAGKDITLWNYMIKRAFEDGGSYYYFLPTYTQAKKVLWDGINNDGDKFINYIPEALIVKKNDQEMKFEIKNAKGTVSIIQLIGTDRFDSVRGTNPKGCVFSEYAFQNPMAWEVVKPILKINGGWAIFNTTPNGKNHAHDLFDMARDNTKWFVERLTVNDTHVLNEEDIQQERDEGMIEEMIQQEYYCSFDVGTLGNYYVKNLQQAIEENRICAVPIENHMQTDVFLDLGRTDATAMIFIQQLGKEIRLIDYYEHTGEAVDHYVKVLREKNYMYKNIWLPHDAFNKRMESKKTIAEQFTEAGFTVKRVVQTSMQNGIEQVRKLFPRFWIDKIKCSQLIKAIENYHKEYDHIRKVFKNDPLHDWSSHACDSLRYMAISINDNTQNKKVTIKLKQNNPINNYSRKYNLKV